MVGSEDKCDARSTTITNTTQIGQSPKLNLYTDASLVGYRGDFEWTGVAEHFKQHLRDTSVLVSCDNMTTVAYIRGQGHEVSRVSGQSLGKCTTGWTTIKLW